MNLKHRKATLDDLQDIIALLADDKLGSTREHASPQMSQAYIDAFHHIEKDANQYLMVVEKGQNIIATCHLTLIPSLTFTGSTRLQIEAVRVHSNARGQGVGKKMIKMAIDWGKTQGATIIQLTTNKERPEALKFYETLGFSATHEGMKLYLSTA